MLDVQRLRNHGPFVALPDADGDLCRYADVADAWAAKVAEIRAAVVKLTDARWDAEQAVRDYRDRVGFTNLADVEAAKSKRDAAFLALDALLTVAVAPEAEVAP